MIKVLYLRSCFNPGGIETLLLNLFNYKQEEIQFHFALMKNSVLIPMLDSKTNKHYCLFRTKFIDIAVIKGLIKLIHKENIRCIHSHQLIELLYALIIKLFISNLKIFHTIHGFSNKWWIEKPEKVLLRFTEQSFTVSHSALQILVNRKFSAHNLQVLYNAVEIPKNPSSSDRAWFQNSIKYSEDDIVIGMIGNFRHEKDHLTLVKAFQELNHVASNVKLVFIGNENHISYDTVIAYIKSTKIENVYFLGSIINANKYLYLFNIFVLSSTSETFGLAVIEALLTKVPVIASDLPVFKELSENGKYFELFETGNYKSLYEKLEINLKRLNNTEKLVITKNSYSYAKEKFGYENYLKRLFSIYHL